MALCMQLNNAAISEERESGSTTVEKNYCLETQDKIQIKSSATSERSEVGCLTAEAQKTVVVMEVETRTRI